MTRQETTTSDEPAPWDPHAEWDDPEPDEPGANHASADQHGSTPSGAPIPGNEAAPHDNGRTRSAQSFVAGLCTRVPHHPYAIEPDGPETPADPNPPPPNPAAR